MCGGTLNLTLPCSDIDDADDIDDSDRDDYNDDQDDDDYNYDDSDNSSSANDQFCYYVFYRRKLHVCWLHSMTFTHVSIQ